MAGRYLLIFLIIPVVFDLRSQDNLFIRTQGFVGKNLTHKEKRVVSETPQSGIQIDLMKQTSGKKYWQYAHNYPYMGLSLTWQQLGNNRVYGQAISILPFMEFRVLQGKNGALTLKHGTGAAWITKHHHPDSNPENLLIGSAVNATSLLDLGYLQNIRPVWWIKTGIVFQHYSNGGLKQPNAGINSGSLYLGIIGKPGVHDVQKTTHTPVTDFRRWRFRVSAGLGLSDFAVENRKIRKSVQLGFAAFIQHSTRFRTGLGIEQYRLLGPGATSIYVEEEIQFSKLATRYAFGSYVYPVFPGENFYSKIGIAWYPKTSNHIPTGLFFGSHLLAHGLKATHIELNTGFVF